jgi:cytochrome bd-type quinol oxidase subunit 2
MSGGARQGLGLLVGAWYVAGAVLLIALLTKGDVDGLATRIGGSALAVIAFGFALVAGARLAERDGYAGLFGASTVLVSIAGFVLLAIEIWSKHPMHQPTRTMVIVVISILFGAGSLLLDGKRDTDDDAVRIARGVAIFGLVALAVLLVFDATGTDVSPRLGGIAAALFVVPAVSLPALRVLRSD